MNLIAKQASENTVEKTKSQRKNAFVADLWRYTVRFHMTKFIVGPKKEQNKKHEN